MADILDPSEKLVTVFGGSGFVGRYIVRAYARRGWRVRVAVRRPDLANFLQPLGGVGVVQAVQANLRYPESLAAAVSGARIVINASGVKAESGRQSYEAVHVFGSHEVARAAKAVGAETLIQISGIGADANSTNAYIASKGRAEAAVRETFPEAILLRPSVVFGPEDEFFNRFAELSRVMPILPVFGGGSTKLQPVYVGDVAAAAASVLDGAAQPGGTYELGGPEVMTLREAMQKALDVVERRRALVSLPFGVSKRIAGLTELASALTLGKFPAALTTTKDQIELLAHDNVVSEAAISERRTLEGLGIAAQGFEAIALSYLVRFRKAGQFEPSRFS
jgi:NADH dehydrogenase